MHGLLCRLKEPCCVVKYKYIKVITPVGISLGMLVFSVDKNQLVALILQLDKKLDILGAVAIINRLSGFS